VRDSVRRRASAGDRLLEFDSAAARAVPIEAIDSIRRSSARGSLSAALAAATRVGVIESADADSLEIVVVSPLAREELDDATLRIRAAWPGRIRIVPVRAAVAADTSPLTIDVGTNREDAVAAGFSLTGASAARGSARLVRGRISPADSEWARTLGHVLLRWPASDADADWPRRATGDAIGGVASGDAILVGRFPRPWMLEGIAIARWADGEPAVVEHAIGEGCIRDIGILIDDASDLTLRPQFRRFAMTLLAPCGGVRDFTPLEAAVRTPLAGSGPLAPLVSLRDEATTMSPWSPWLFALAALLLTGELAYRRAGARAA
jgi:hypothetical protein